MAFYYQRDLPVDELQAFDAVVVDPARAQRPAAGLAPHTAWFARLDLSGRHFPHAVDDAFLNERVQPLWAQGYTGFLLDDGAPASATDTAETTAVLEAVIDAIHARYPDARIMLRNHRAVAQARAGVLAAWVVDSLYQRAGGYGGLMAQVPADERVRLLDEIRNFQAKASGPVFAIDYCPTSDKSCRRTLAKRLVEDGVQPFVTAPGMGIVGMGRLEVMPRKILMVQAVPADLSQELSVGVAAASMPLNYLGYDVRYVDVNTQPLPDDIRSDRYAGIVVVMTQDAPRAARWRQWLLARIQEGMRVAVIGSFGFPLDSAAVRALGLQEVAPGALPASGTSVVLHQAPMMGFETMPAPDATQAVGIRVGQAGQPLLRLQHADAVYDAAALTPWGGFVLAPYGVVSQDAIAQYRWTVQPLDFYRQALQLPDMPVPDVTSENGRRLMFTHVDGDGFPSEGEFSGATDRYSGEVLYDRIFTRYPIPMSVSIIEGEVSAGGAYPELSAVLEPIARKILALPNVEVASHTYSHPFFMTQIDNVTGQRVKPFHEAPEDRGDPFSLKIPGYQFNLDREISGSIDYINRRLAPPGKKVEAIFWPGDAAPPALALSKAAQAGVLSINGGSTIITKSDSSWTNIAPYGESKGLRPDQYQVYASVMNENVYTNDWLGPFYGFNRVLETFAMTDSPIRFKALDIYYHFYSGTKKASLNALEGIFAAVMKQPVFPVYVTDYIRRVQQWRRVAVAREGDGWRVRSGADLRQLRWPGHEVPDLSTAQGVAGYLPGPGGLYIHMGADQARFHMAAVTQQTVPYVREASGFLRHVQRQGRDLTFDIGGYYQPFVQLAGMSRCTPQVTGKGKLSRRSADVWRLDLTGHVAKPVAYQTIRVHCE